MYLSIYIYIYIYICINNASGQRGSRASCLWRCLLRRPCGLGVTQRDDIYIYIYIYIIYIYIYIYMCTYIYIYIYT